MAIKFSKEMTIVAAVENIDQVTDFINAELEELNCPMRARVQIDVAIDEIFANIANYAYPNGTGSATVSFEATEDPHGVRITFTDRGIPFNPLEKEDPDTTLGAEEREIGGLGIFMVKKSMDEMTYEYRDGQNVLCIRKRL